MNRKEAAIEITNEFISEFNDTTPVSFDNQSTFWYCTSPISSTTKQSSKPWLTFSIIDNTTSKATLGTKGHRRFRRVGFISCQVFVPEGTGTSSGRDICEEIVNIFEGERIATDIVFKYGDYLQIGNDNSGWYQYDITIYFSFDEPK
jgi:hypothetical protein